MEKIAGEIELLRELENASIDFDDISGSSDCKDMDQFFVRRRHEILDIFCLSESYFALPKKQNEIKVTKTIFFRQNLKDLENIYRDVGGYDESYDEFKDLCRKTWQYKHNHLWINRSKKEDPGRYCICNESKNTYTDSTPETKIF